MVKKENNKKNSKSLNKSQREQLSKYFADLSKGILVVVATVLFARPADYFIYSFFYLLLAIYLVYLSMFIIKGGIIKHLGP